MICDRPRLAAYLEALRKAIRPGSVVVDVGTGTGAMAFLACQLGARRVYAIEPGSAIAVAREIAQANGLTDRIVFLQELSTKVTLPERADVIVSDMRGILPLLQQHIPSIVDARKRLLAPAGVLINQRDTVWVAPVEARMAYRNLSAPWTRALRSVDMRRALQVATNSISKIHARLKDLLAKPERFVTLDYTTVEEANVSGTLKWKITRRRTAHGLCAWFDAELAGGVRFSNAPGAPKLIYGQLFFPFSEPLALSAGDAVQIELEAKFVGGDYIWRWNTDVRGAHGCGNARAQFRQSTFYGMPLAAEVLRKQAASFVPALNEEGEVDRFLLAQMDGTTPQEEIARRAAARFPSHFSGSKDALTRLGELSAKYSR
jgi:protein arginine N-methyltransferase 1